MKPNATNKAPQHGTLTSVVAITFMVLILTAAIHQNSPHVQEPAVGGLPLHFYSHEERSKTVVTMPALLAGEYRSCGVNTDGTVNCDGVRESRSYVMDVYFDYSGTPKPGEWECRRNEQSLTCSQ